MTVRRSIALLLLCLVFDLGRGVSQPAGDPSELEDFKLIFSHPAVGRVYVGSLYDYTQNRFYIPVVEIFDRLDIRYQRGEKATLLEGIFLLGGKPYRMDFDKRTIQLGETTHPIGADGMFMGATDYYLSPEAFEQVFDMRFEVSLSTLSIRLDTPHQMPVAERKQREQRQATLDRNYYDQATFPMRYPRRRDVLSGGFLDYQVSTAGDVGNPSRNMAFVMTGAAHVLGGGLQGTMTGSYDPVFGLTQKTDQFRWRYALDPNPWLTDVTVGQIGTKGLQNDRILGVSLTNEPIESRQIYGTYLVDGRTDPESEVELYLNNTLVDFTTADGNGYYRFDLPLRYGTTRLETRIITPNGELRVRDREIQVPFVFLPEGTASYNIEAGKLDKQIGFEDDDAFAMHGNVGYGVTSWLTTRLGLDHQTRPGEVPQVYGVASARVFGSYLVNMDVVPSAFYKAQTNVVFPTSHSLSLAYTYFDGTSRYNRQGAKHQISTSAYAPFGFLSSGLRAGAETFVYDTQSLVRFSSDLFTRIGRLNVRFNYRDQLTLRSQGQDWAGGQLRTSVTYSLMRGPSVPAPLRGTFLRATTTHDVRQKQIRQIEGQLSRSIGRTGRFTLGVSQLLPQGVTIAQVGLNLDLGGKARSSSDYRGQRQSHQYRQSIRGSVGLDARNGFVQLTDRQQVGGGAMTVTLFVDNSGSGTYEPENGDELIPHNAVRLDRSAQAQVDSDGRVRLTQLQSFHTYNLEINRRALPHPMLVAGVDPFSFVVDPHQFKPIEIPFYRSGVIDGQVGVLRDSLIAGQGGLRLYLNGLDREYAETIRSFQGGGFYAMDVPPGRYTLQVDPSQLDFLGLEPRDGILEFKVESMATGHYLDGLQIVLIPKQTEQIPAPLTDMTLMAGLMTDLLEAKSLYLRAQNELFLGNFAAARNAIDQSLRLFESDHGLALKGSIEYVLGNRTEAMRLWIQAKERNPGIALPDTAVLDYILQSNRILLPR